MRFELQSSYAPSGDQPEAIRALTHRIQAGQKHSTLLGVTGSGKTFTVANVIQNIQKPVLVISHNKTLVAQLYSEFKEFFPQNAVEYFVSYFDYYQPEAYMPQTDTFIEKDSSINEDIDRLRLRATSSLLSRRDCIVVASVSCIYGLGSPKDYEKMLVFVRQGKTMERDTLLESLVAIRYERNDIDFKRGTFRAKGDTVDIFLAYEEKAVRVIFDFDTIRAISLIDPLTAKKLQDLESTAIYPAKHYVTTDERLQTSLVHIEKELEERVAQFNLQHKFLEAQRIQQRTRYDLEMMAELGYCSGIENYSRYLSGREPGEKPFCLLDYYPEDYLIVIDESHVTLPQIRGMYHGDRSRKETLVEFGFRLPSALDNRPLKWDEFMAVAPQMLFVSATPGVEEVKLSGSPVEQVIRPTGLLDPEITLRPTRNQIDDLIREVQACAEAGERVLVTTLTKRMAEDLARFLGEKGVRVKYLHSEIGAIERVEIIRDLRKKEFDCLVGINLLREGLDIPEVALVAILDADKEGFLRSETSLIQTAGRAARHQKGRVILYADAQTHSIRQVLKITEQRRRVQSQYNTQHGITPQSVQKAIGEGIEAIRRIREVEREATGLDEKEYERSEEIARLEEAMEMAARNLQFEKAITLRDRIQNLKKASEPKLSLKPVLKNSKPLPRRGGPK